MEYLKLALEYIAAAKWQEALSNLTKVMGIGEDNNAYFKILMNPQLYSSALDLLRQSRRELITALLQASISDVEENFENYIRPLHQLIALAVQPIDQDQILPAIDQEFLHQCESIISVRPVVALLGITLYQPLNQSSAFRNSQNVELPHWFIPYYAVRLVGKDRQLGLDRARELVLADNVPAALSALWGCLYPLPLTTPCKIAFEAFELLYTVYIKAETGADGETCHRVLQMVRDIRNFVVEYLLQLSNDTLSKVFPTAIEHYYTHILRFIDLSQCRLSDSEKEAVKKLQSEFYAQGELEGKQIQIMLALGLYDLPHRVVPFVSIPLSDWFMNFYWNKFIDRLFLWFRDDDVEEYVNYKTKVLTVFRNLFFASRNNPQWLKIAREKLSSCNFPPILMGEQNLKPLMSLWAEITEETIRLQGIPVEHLISPRQSDRTKIRIGVIGVWLNRNEITTAFPFFGYLPREEFEIFFYLVLPAQPEVYERLVSRVDRVTLLEGELLDRVRTIRSDDLDIILIARNIVGTGDITYQLCCHRLARVQIVLSQSPCTTGCKYADYYFLGELDAELDIAQNFYKEELVILPGAIHRFATREIPPAPASISFNRSDLGFSSDAIIFASGTAFVKFTPKLVRTWAEILAEVPNSYLILYPFGGSWCDFNPVVSFNDFVVSILSEYGVNSDRVLIIGDKLPSPADCVELLKICDIYLDSFPMSGTHSMADALEANIPIVELEGKQLRTRQGAAILRYLQLDEMVTTTVGEYKELAIKLAQSKELRQEWGQKIAKIMADDPFSPQSLTEYLVPIYKELLHRWDTEGYIMQFKEVGDQCLIHGDLAMAERCYRKLLELKPDEASVIANLATIHVCAEQLEVAEALYRKAIEIDPKLAKAYWMLGNLLKKKGEVEEAEKYKDQALELQPDLLGAKNYLDLGAVESGRGDYEKALKFLNRAVEMQPDNKVVLMQLARTLLQLERHQEAIQTLEKLVQIQPDNPEFELELGKTLVELNMVDEGIAHLEKALKLSPYYVAAHSQLCNAYNKLANHFGRDDAWLKWRQSAWEFARLCKDRALVETTMALMSALLHAGLNQDERLLNQVRELEELMEDEERVNKLPPSEIAWLYTSIIFNMQDIRDDRRLNCNLAKKIGKLYTEKMVLPAIDREGCKQRLQVRIDKQRESKTLDRNLTIGIVSPYFRRHSVGWCSFDAIAELATLTTVNLYSTDKIKDKDSRTQQFEAVAAKFFNPSTKARAIHDVCEEILKDEIDVLIELDSVTAPHHLHLLNSYLAPVRCSWLGFDAPFTSEENYFIGDWYTHPEGVEDCYTEKLVRMPDSHMSIGYLAHVRLDREAIRRSLGISEDQVVYLYTPSARKFNVATAKAHVSILKRVENSILYRKGTGDVAAVRAIYQRECEEQGVDPRRVLVVAKTRTEEEHRGIYRVADVFLDSYPYNGGTQNMEALYACLPAVTHVGDTAFARMGLSFLSTLGIETGIGYSWEEYIEWGVRYGTDRDLRLSVHEHLKKARDPDNLSPLWNPRKFAQDLLKLVTDLYIKEVYGEAKV
ncbi:MAG: tetratricopeptide repeat protein [Pseudanabaenaceae cyanobacterium SKYGB_i_bin29]|nr:tetratricopeptide repeat protein [Pseudanabaenaceae cyanobacterium SKYG29]MDW8421059.1 tetratricopeptide repeat protein [Pseudanabaenaceae cyanobacterium SKYGB_i_bin29]